MFVWKSQVRIENQENNGWEIGRDSQKKEGYAAASAKRQNSAVIAYAVAAAKRVWRKNVRKQSEQSNAESSWSHRQTDPYFSANAPEGGCGKEG